MRDDFPAAVKTKLGQRAGWSCSNPGCRQPTSGPAEANSGVTNVGVAAHITAASQDGPRYDPSLAAQERAAPDNGVWLCQRCAKAVDDDPVTYTVDLLRDWRLKAETLARDAIERRLPKTDKVRSNPTVRVLVHRAFFDGNPTEHFFVKIVNTTPDADVEVTHVWYQSNDRVDILVRRLPVRLRPSETWETFIAVADIPRDADAFDHFHAHLSTGEVYASSQNKDVPPRGFVAG